MCNTGVQDTADLCDGGDQPQRELLPTTQHVQITRSSSSIAGLRNRRCKDQPQRDRHSSHTHASARGSLCSSSTCAGDTHAGTQAINMQALAQAIHMQAHKQ